MNKKLHIFFDLDGTLANTERPLLHCIGSALAACSLPELPYETKLKFIGPPLMDSIRLYCGADEQTAREAYRVFRSLYDSEGVYMSEKYSGVEEMIKALYDSGARLYTATSKPEKFARIILEGFGLDQYFTYIAGASLDESRVTKEQVIRYALQTNGISAVDRCVLVGDRCFDAEGAAAVGMDCIGVLWGFGSREELEAAGCVAVCDTPQDVSALLCPLIDR